MSGWLILQVEDSWSFSLSRRVNKNCTEYPPLSLSGQYAHTLIAAMKDF